MREPKRLAHRQAERNKARAMKHWTWEENLEDLGVSWTMSDSSVEDRSLDSSKDSNTRPLKA